MIQVNNLLVAVNFDESSNVALVYARSLAKTFGARLHVLHVMENLFLRPMANEPRAIEAGITRRLLDCLTDEDRTTLHAVPVIRKSDAPADEIVKYRAVRRHRSHRDGHPRPARSRPPSHGQRGREGGPDGAVPGAHASTPGARIRGGRRDGAGLEHLVVTQRFLRSGCPDREDVRFAGLDRAQEHPRRD